MKVYVSESAVEIPQPLLERSDIVWLWPDKNNPIPEAQLYIWSYSPEIDVRRLILERRDAQHLLVTEQKYLGSLGDLQDKVCILFKPVAHFTFKAFVELALENSRAKRQNAEAEVLRIDRELLLKYVLEVNLKLQQYDQERSNFLARALHDFRSPLTAIYGYCGLLAEGRLGAISPRQAELLDRMRQSTARLTRLASGTLDLLLAGRTEKPLQLKESEMGEVLHRALSDVSTYLEEKHVRTDVTVERQEGALWLEPEKIQQVLVNLLENSCRFVPVGGAIRITGYPVFEAASESEGVVAGDVRETGYRVDIVDSGPGVPAALAEKIFEEYASFSGGGDRSAGGLGLAICRSVIHAHGGSIWATPSSAGGKFSFVIPIEQVRTEETEPAITGNAESAKGADASPRTAREDLVLSCDALDPAPVLHVLPETCELMEC